MARLGFGQIWLLSHRGLCCIGMVMARTVDNML